MPFTDITIDLPISKFKHLATEADDVSKTFIPPLNFLFKSYGDTFVDILMDPDGMTQANPDTATAIAVNGIYIRNTAVDFPLKAEGNLVPATGGSGKGGEPPLFHWAAKVPNVRLVVKNGAVVINPPNPDKDIANITPVPAMPALNAHLEPIGLPGEVTWTFRVTYTKHLRADDDTYPKAGPKKLPYATTWEIIPDMNGDFRGGDATVTAVYMGQTLTQDFLIHGLNPTPDDARAYINGIASAPPYAKAIIDHESMGFHQFNPPDGKTNPGEPNFGVDSDKIHGGWGMGQLDNKTMAIKANWLWNWHENVDEAIVIMIDKLAGATAFYNTQVSQQMIQAPLMTIDTVHLVYGGIPFLTTAAPHVPENALGIQNYNGTSPGGAVSHFLFSWNLGPNPHWNVYGAPWRTYTDLVCDKWRTADQ